ncbi:hypothetical protein FGG08_001702 [Glutinoglossum americanum]|uniref:F-box domain-containing protein n=1 Tax=Glutinoglossum americanum TaxID=1670608 RepID=A0A9P8L539_9PEZI|nr:hypothetical protein FGG08_001702 [Glutinoglossum americanum]
MCELYSPEVTEKQLSKAMATQDRAFYTLPHELNKAIALFIENDIDLCSYQLVCKQTYYAVNSDQSVWRERFLGLFERVPIDSNFKTKYQVRRKILRAGATFTGGYTKKERKCLLVIRELILGSCAYKDKRNEVASLNYDRLLSFCLSTNILKDVLLGGNMKPDPLLAITQLLLTPWCLELNLNFPTWSFPNSQQAAYLDSKVPEGQIFQGRNNQRVNAEWLLHISNFFKYHMTREEEYSLFEEFDSLDPSEKPKMWTGRLGDVPGLAKCWKGSYAFLDATDVTYLRRTQFISTDIFIDNMDGFQTMILDPIANVPVAVKLLFELFDRSSSAGKGIERSVAKEMDRNALYFESSGYDHHPFDACIRVHPLPPQQGFPGWQRFSMVKYFHDPTSSNPFVDDLWAYEGCVLPGGEMILGRWFYLDPNLPASGAGVSFAGSGPYSGPFIFWKTPNGPCPEALTQAQE